MDTTVADAVIITIPLGVLKEASCEALFYFFTYTCTCVYMMYFSSVFLSFSCPLSHSALAHFFVCVRIEHRYVWPSTSKSETCFHQSNGLWPPQQGDERIHCFSRDTIYVYLVFVRNAHTWCTVEPSIHFFVCTSLLVCCVLFYLQVVLFFSESFWIDQDLIG